jgi:hypothetical protein
VVSSLTSARRQSSASCRIACQEILIEFPLSLNL